MILDPLFFVFLCSACPTYFVRPDKRGAIPDNLPPILERMGIDLETWLTNTTEFDSIYCKRFAKPRERKGLANTA